MTGPDPSIPENRDGAVLTVDLDAVRANYRILLERLKGVPSAAVVKADGYGLGADKVASALAADGCDTFFVAHLEEGVRLRPLVPNCAIHILNGLLSDAADAYQEHRLTPVLGSLGEIDAWKAFCGDAPLPCDIHVDTGMLRLGLPPDELDRIAANPSHIAGLDITYVISHLASADETDSPQNPAQLAAYQKARRVLPQGKACFANSSGIFLGADYHFDLARPGVALYGVNPQPGTANPMQGTVTLKGRILQIRGADAPQTIGYGASYEVSNPSRIATVPVGYADGYLRSLSNRACGYIGDHRVPLVGRVSMDLITFDVTGVPDHLCRPGDWIELIGPNRPVDAVAEDAGTIGYEILTSLGRRYHRAYIGEDA